MPKPKQPARKHYAELVRTNATLRDLSCGLKLELEAQRQRAAVAEIRAAQAEQRTRQLMSTDVQHVPWEHPRLFRVEIKVDAGPFKFHANDFVQMISRELTGKLLDAFNKGGF